MKVGDKLMRLQDGEKNKKWPADLEHKVVTVTKVEGKRVFLAEARNEKGWLASRFIKEDHPDFNPLRKWE